jgi:hypothetical protein
MSYWKDCMCSLMFIESWEEIRLILF